MSTCGQCSDVATCRLYGCEAEFYEAQQREAEFAQQQQAEEYGRRQALDYYGACAAHETHRRTCSDCLIEARTACLLPCDPVPRSPAPRQEVPW